MKLGVEESTEATVSSKASSRSYKKPSMYTNEASLAVNKDIFFDDTITFNNPCF